MSKKSGGKKAAVKVDLKGVIVRCTYKEMVPISELKQKFNARNRNIHPPEQIERLAKILKHQGIRRPAVLSTLSDKLQAGHGRILAAELIGMSHYPCDIQDYDDPEMEYQDLIADNEIARWAEVDLSGINNDIGDLGPFDIELLGIKDFTVTMAEKLEPGCNEDEVPEQVDTRVKLGDVWQLGRHRLMCGDSTSPDDTDKLFNKQNMDLCFTSPPYSDQRDYSGKLELDPEHLAKFMMAPCDLFVVNLGLQRKDGEIFPYWESYIKVAKELGLKFISWNIWDKMESGSIGNLTAMFPIEHEWIFVFGKKKDLNRTVTSVSAGKLKTKKFAVREKSGKISYRNNGSVTPETKKLGTVLSMSPYKARNEDLNHPAVFPVDFAVIHIEALTDVGQNVYEPFGGSGSALVACEKSERKCFIMEINESYCGTILARWEKYTGQTAERLTEGGVNGEK